MIAPFHLAGESLQFDPAGALVWPAERVLVFADLHLEKGSAAARAGQLVPPWDSRVTLERVARLLRRYTPRTVIALGDSFHDNQAAARLAPADEAALRRMTDAEWGTRKLCFRHQATAGETGEISGHFHPKAKVATRAGQIVRPCFVADASKIILPAFGAYTGGLDVRSPAITAHFPRGARVFLLGAERLFSFPVAHTVPLGAACFVIVPLCVMSLDKLKIWESITRPSFTDWLIAIFAFGQVIALCRQIRISHRQTDIQRAQHIASHRPRIVVRGVELAREPHSGPRNGRIPHFIEFVVFNSGASNARILEGAIETTPALADGRIDFFRTRGRRYLKNEMIKPGHTIEGHCEVPLNHNRLVLPPRSQANAEGTRLVFRGGFTYADETDVIYRMAFAYAFDPQDRTFQRAKYQDANYDD